jgi:outer membrane lipoprotein-sorting protein
MNPVLLASLVFVAPVGDVSPNMRAHADAISAAAGLQVRYTVTPVGGAAQEYRIAFSRPGMARIETPKRIVVSDGETVTVYDRSSNSFTKQPYAQEVVFAEFGAPELGVWSAFFDARVVDMLASTKDLGQRKLRGKQFEAVAVGVDKEGTTTATLYLDSADMMPRIVDFTIAKGASKSSMILDVLEISLDPVEAAAYAYTPPAGAKEVDLASMSAGTWLHDLQAALEVAKATGKLVMVDFMASWCGPCKAMDKEVFQSEKFKSSAGDFVLVKIDVDEQTAVAQRYKVEAMPTVKFLRPDGSVVHEFVGYDRPETVYAEMNKARAKKG